MFHDIDAALRSLLAAGLPAGVAITFAGPPVDDGGAGGTVNVFLHQVCEDRSGRLGGFTEIRDDRGRVVARKPPSKRFRACYVVTGWAATVQREHELLGAALAALTVHDTIPHTYLTGVLAALESPVALAVGDVELPGTPAGMWQALGIPPRVGLDVVVTAAFAPEADTALARPAAVVDLGVGRGLPESVSDVSQPPPEKRLRERG